MDEPKEKRYRQVQVWISELQAKKTMERLNRRPVMETVRDKVLVSCNLPERLAWLIEKRIGPNSIFALSCLYLYQFSKEEQPLNAGIIWGEKPMNKLLKDFLKAFAVGKAGLHIDYVLPEETKKAA